MFLAEKMLFVNLLIMQDDRLAATRYLADAGCLHLVEQKAASASDNIKSWSGDEITAGTCEARLRRIDALLGQLDSVVLDDVEAVDDVMQYDSAELMEKSEEAVEELSGKIDKTIRQRHEVDSRITQLDLISEEMHLLDECGLSPADLDKINYLYVAFGVLPQGALRAITPELNNLIYNLSFRNRGGSGDLILLLGDKDKSDDFDRTLNVAGFSHHNIPERYLIDYEEGMDLIEMDLWAARDQLAEIKQNLNKHREKWVQTLSYWRKVLSIQLILLKATGNFGYVGDVAVVSGFLPLLKKDEILHGLAERFAGRYFIEYKAAEEQGRVSVPTKLRNWKIFRPFEMFVKNYGLPRYNDIDPTPFVAVSFLIMFGMMFGDVGHGMILAAAGAAMAFLPYRFFVAMRDLGKILMMSGISGIGFGFLFGSIFGIESDSVLPALWMRPAEGENLNVLLGTSLIIGVVVISLGIILNIIQALRQRDPAKALVGQWSLSSLVFYWMLLGLIIFYTTGHSIDMPTGIIALIVALPLILIVAGQFAVHHFGKSADEEEFEIASLLFEPIEILMNLFTNSASFLRVAAFGLAHAALTMVTFILKDMTPSAGLNFISMPLQHLFIIALEGMIVTIQCLRMEYYEFFSKFFKGDGTEFVPLVVDDVE